MKKLLTWLYSIFVLMGLSAPIFGYNVLVPTNNADVDVIVQDSVSRVEGDENDLFSLIQRINEYLRFGIGVICMWVLVFGGIKLMSAQWDENKMDQANKLLLWALVGILISILSYAAIRLIINLF